MSIATRCRPIVASSAAVLLLGTGACRSDASRAGSDASRPSQAVALAGDAATYGWPSYSPAAGPPAGWTGPVFQISQAFPKTQPPPDSLPFLQVDFRKNPTQYLRLVQAYIYAGNINRGTDSAGQSLDWVTQTNPVRTWYNMPWRTAGNTGREFVHGLTREFPAAAHSLDPAQDSSHDTYARAIYNPTAGYTLGQVWPNPNGAPVLSKASFLPGAVIAKLLFTTADSTDVPETQGAYTWQANVYTTPGCDTIGCPRGIRPVRLFQMDFAIKDVRAPITQWVFGTFVYDKNAPGTSVWDKMVPLGLMFGNDPELTSTTVNGVVHESRILPVSMYEHLGCHKRLTGPLDNPKSSCMSCHMASQHPAVSSIPAVNDTTACDAKQNAAFWRDLPPGQPFTPTVDGQSAVSLDFSMEMTSAVQNYYTSEQPAPGQLKARAMVAIRRDTSFFDVVRLVRQEARHKKP